MNDRNVAHVLEAVCGTEGLTSCKDVLSYDVKAQHIQHELLPALPPKLRQYFDADVEPLLRQNMEVGCAGWTNNACESMNHVLKQRTQWRITHLPELTDNCRALMEAQYKEADRALLGLGNFSLRPSHARHRQTVRRWQSMSDRQRQRVVGDCFRLVLPCDTSTSTDGNLTVNYQPAAGKNLNQRKRPRADRTASK